MQGGQKLILDRGAQKNNKYLILQKYVYFQTQQIPPKTGFPGGRASPPLPVPLS